ncbi:ATP-binding protein [Streptomyces sp. NPDC005953]|uniref:ATP-binding protein n=1 Tax=Streptomyces sp. NPDC005953 TaxID=3156719 RepID=UPI0033E24CFE
MMTKAESVPIGCPSYSEVLDGVPQSVRRARVLVMDALEKWDLAELTDSAVLVASELVANSVEHSGCRVIHVVVSRPTRSAVRVAVLDASPRLPVVREADLHAERGRGLAVISALSCRWGTEQLDWGKRVWAELTLS